MPIKYQPSVAYNTVKYMPQFYHSIICRSTYHRMYLIEPIDKHIRPFYPIRITYQSMECNRHKTPHFII